MKFNRCIWKRNEARERTKGRVAAAKRKFKRDAESVALFPELAKHKTVEDQMSDQEKTNSEWAAKYRDHQAAAWRRARHLLREMPPITAAGIKRWWQSDIYLPRDASYLLDAIYQNKKRSVCYWRILRIRHQFKLIQQNRLPRSVLQSIRAWD